jgi:pathogenesis-related protein 1
MLKRHLFGLLAAALATGLSPGTSAAPTGSAFTEEEADALVKEHNDARDLVGVKQRVTWSKDLARYAQERADRIAETGKLEHSPDRKYGENVAAGQGERSGAREAASAWLKEKEAYEAGKREPEKAGHYTQMVWSRTTRIGAGKAVIKEGPMKGWTVIVCDYDPPGNLRGEKPYP